MSEGNHKLIDLDQMEPSRVRRRLRQWSKTEEAAAALIQALQVRGCLSRVRVYEPVYETNVYPLYFYWRHGQRVSHRHVYHQVLQLPLLATHRWPMPQDELLAHVRHTVDSEVDILVEDTDYFVFIEAKEVSVGHKIKFEQKRGVHQLVSQYVQGMILQSVISKVFVLATIGANNGETLEINLNSTERALLQLVGEDKDTLAVVDLTWPSVTMSVQAGTQA